MVGVGFAIIITSVLHVLLFPHASTTVQVMVDVPTLKEPLASTPVPFLVVAPVITYVMVRAPLQLSLAVIAGII
jgi:hypothetical protein